MTSICVLGWYGTETIGDRAILDGLFRLFDKIYGQYGLYLGSLNPFFSERTLIEDGWIYKKTAPGMKLFIVDETDDSAMKNIVKKCDLVVMGGGPVMNVNELSIITNIFHYAYKYEIKTMLLGVGLGPFRSNYFIKEAEKLIQYSDVVVFRDALSYEYAIELYGNKEKYVSLCDPAIFSVMEYRKIHTTNIGTDDYVACNFRKFPKFEYGSGDADPEKIIYEVVESIVKSNRPISLIPMHTFAIGGDDRKYLYSIKRKYSEHDLSLPSKPLSLYETYEAYARAKACVGMRYHSVVLQTILNGNNIILDYTDLNKGKVVGFLKTFDLTAVFESRYISLRNTDDLKKYDTVVEAVLGSYRQCGIDYATFEKKVNYYFDNYCTLLKSEEEKL